MESWGNREEGVEFDFLDGTCRELRSRVICCIQGEPGIGGGYGDAVTQGAFGDPPPDILRSPGGWPIPSSPSGIEDVNGGWPGLGEDDRWGNGAVG